MIYLDLAYDWGKVHQNLMQILTPFPLFKQN